MSECIFCKIIEGHIPAQFESQNDNVVAIKDINPRAPVHILIIPKEHIPQISDLKTNQAGLVGEMVDMARRIAAQKKIKDYRLVFNNGSEAGQSVFHIHLHLLGGRVMNWPPG